MKYNKFGNSHAWFPLYIFFYLPMRTFQYVLEEKEICVFNWMFKKLTYDLTLLQESTELGERKIKWSIHWHVVLIIKYNKILYSVILPSIVLIWVFWVDLNIYLNHVPIRWRVDLCISRKIRAIKEKSKKCHPMGKAQNTKHKTNEYSLSTFNHKIFT